MSHNTSHGWIKLYRRLLEHPLWLNSTPQQKVVLVTLLLLANHAEKQWEWQGRPYTCKPGQLITSLESLRKKCGTDVSLRQIRTALKRLEKMEFLTRTVSHHNTQITICNWERYQWDDSEDVKSVSEECPTQVQRVTTNKNDKECKNERTPSIPRTGEGGELSKEALRVLQISREIEHEYLTGHRLPE